MKHKLFRTLALICAAAFLISAVPLTAAAAEVTVDAVSSAEQDMFGTEESPIQGEDKTQRERSIKYYRCEDGTYVAAIYNTPVHYQLNGQWEDIDNTLIADSTKGGVAYYTNTANDFRVHLPAELNTNAPASVEKDGYTLSWVLQNSAAVSGRIVEKAETQSASTTAKTRTTVTADGTTVQKIEAGNEEKMTLPDRRGAVRYEKVFTDTELRYDVVGDTVKESLILNSITRQTSYTFAISASGLRAELQTDKSVIFYEKDGTAAVFSIAAPYMFDDAGEYSDDVAVSLRATAEGYSYTITPSRIWLSDTARQYPVTIDPTIVTNLGADKISATQAYSVYPDKNYGNAHLLYAGSLLYNNTPQEYRTFIRLTMPENDSTVRRRVISAKLRLSYFADYNLYGNNAQINAHQITSAWEENALTWNNKPTYNTAVTDYIIGRTGGGGLSFDITPLVDGWISGSIANNGVMIKGNVVSSTENRNVCFYADNVHTDYLSQRPYAVISYRDCTGLEDYWTYTSLSTERGATTAVNHATGALTAIIPECGVDGNLMPVSISHVYNPHFTEETTYGGKWRLNYQMHLESVEGIDGYNYKFIDGDGSIHYLYTDSDNVIRDEDGLGLTLTVSGQGSSVTYTLTDKDKNQYIFNSAKNLTTIKNQHGKSIRIVYANGRITEIYDGASRKYTLRYNSEGRLSSIVDPGNRITSYGYSSASGRLNTVTHPDILQYYIAYGDTGELTTILTSSGQKLTATYDQKTPKRVSTLTLSNQAQSITAAKYSFDYQFYATTVTDLVTNTNGNRYTYQFNDFLQTVCVVSHTDGSAKSYKYGKPGGVEQSGEENKLLMVSDTQKSVVNHIRNPRADTTPLSSGAFSSVIASGQTASITWDSTKGHTAAGSIKVSRSAVTEGSGAYVYAMQAYTIPTTGYYSASAFVTTSGITSGSGALLRFERWNGSTLKSNLQVASKATDWERLGATVYCEAGDSLRVLLGVNDTATMGNMWYDDVQFEYLSESINTVNLLENTDFTNSLTGWTQGSGTWSVTTNTSSDKPADATKVVSVAGSGTADRYLYQDIAVNGKKGDVFSLGAWAKSTSVYIDPENDDDGIRAFSISLIFYNGTTEVGRRRISFNRAYNGWQFVSGEAIADKAYTKVRVRLEYNRNANTALFALPYLYKDNYGQSYKYDKDGNVVSTEDQTQNATAYDYTDNRLSKLASPTGSELLMTYDETTGDLLTTMDTNGQRYTYTYDSAGNVTRVQMGADTYATSPTSGQSYYLINARTGRALDGNDGTHNTLCSTSAWSSTDVSQVFTMVVVDDEQTFYFHPLTDTNLRLDVEGNAATENLNIQIYNANGNDCQYFRLSQNDNRSFTILTKVSGYTKCLDERDNDTTLDPDDTILRQRTVEANNAGQQWYLVEYKPDVTSSAYTQSDLTYTSNQNYLYKVTDELGNTTTYNTNASTGNTDSVESPNGASTHYTYDSEGLHTQSVSVKNNGSTIASVSYAYDVDRLTGIHTLGGTQYSLQYDSLGRSTGVWLGAVNTGTRLAQYTYNSNGLLSALTYGNNNITEYTYDALGRQTSVWYNGVTAKSIDTAYNDRGQIGLLKDRITSTRTRYWYDLAGRVIRVRRTYGIGDGGALYGQVLYGYEDATNRLSSIKVNTPVGASLTTIGYAANVTEAMLDAVYKVSVDNTQEIGYAYDGLGRLTGRGLSVPNVNTTYTYTAVDGNRTSAQIASVSENGTTTSYTYDSVGNIATVKIGNTLDESYTYDALGQLTTAFMSTDVGNYNWEYTYDDNGNILSATGETDLIMPTTDYIYTYGDTAWPDKLTAVNGSPITYDAIGNPLSYWDGKTFTWQNGRQLAQTQVGTKTVTYTYNADGGRHTKTVDGVTTQYYYVDGVLYGQNTGSNTLFFLYDEQGVPFAVKLNGAKYYYKYNLQGDVVGLYDSNGTQVVKYEYDPWGKILNQTDDSLVNLATLNPLRYRGYIYDAETGLYYLNSRYYDPETGRFINADGQISGVGGDILGYNMFAYCFNNPVNMSDPTGHWPKWLTGALNVVSGTLQMAAGIALGATAGWTGIGAVAAGFLVVNGAATVMQGSGQIANSITKSTIAREDNVAKTAVQNVGGAIGGDTGAKIAGGLYDVAAVAANLYAGKVGLQQTGLAPIKVNINKVLNNPMDEFVTCGPAPGVISDYCRSIPLNGYGKIYATQLPNGFYQLANGHHRVAALRSLGKETIKIFLTK